MTSKNEALLKGVGLRLKNIRKNKNLRLEEMSNALGVSEDVYLNYENGKSILTLGALEVLQERFDISMDWLLFDRGLISSSDREVLDKLLMECGDISGEMKSFLLLMNKDPIFKYQELGNYYEYLKTHPAVN